MLYKLPGAVYIASYKVPLDQSDCRKLFVQLCNNSNSVYKPHTTHNSSIRSDEGLALETSAFESLYGG